MNYIADAISLLTLLSVWRIPSKVRAESSKIRKHFNGVSHAYIKAFGTPSEPPKDSNNVG